MLQLHLLPCLPGCVVACVCPPACLQAEHLNLSRLTCWPAQPTCLWFASCLHGWLLQRLLPAAASCLCTAAAATLPVCVRWPGMTDTAAGRCLQVGPPSGLLKGRTPDQWTARQVAEQVRCCPQNVPGRRPGSAIVVRAAEGHATSQLCVVYATEGHARSTAS